MFLLLLLVPLLIYVAEIQPLPSASFGRMSVEAATAVPHNHLEVNLKRRE